MRQQAAGRRGRLLGLGGLCLTYLLLAARPSAASPWQQPGPVWGTPRPTLSAQGALVAEAVGLALVPAGRLGDHAAASGSGGLGLGAIWRFCPAHAGRLGLRYNYASLPASQPELAGNLYLHHVQLRADYVWGSRWLQPYAGLGASVLPWSGRITQVASGLANASPFSVSAGGLVAVGVDLHLVDNLRVAPEGTWSYVGGDFRAAFWQAGIALRWEI